MSQPTRQLFGTDGIRGIAGQFPLTLDTIYAIGRALGHDLLRAASTARAVIGQDTRESSGWIADRLSAGLRAVGVEVHSAGVITTPGVAYLARSRGYSAGVVISASHNPWPDNGIKIFSGDGFKLPDAHELEIEKEIFALIADPLPQTASPGENSSLPGEPALRDDYIQWLAGSAVFSSLHQDWSGSPPLQPLRSSDSMDRAFASEADRLRSLRVLVDCANGAAAAEAPELFRRLNIHAHFLNVSPNGRNINQACGALHPDTVARAVAAAPGKYDLGVTFDGDADRALFCDASGHVVNGDGILLLAARDFQMREKLTGSMIVATTMSNMGLEVALNKSGIQMARANVGDKYVLEEMLRTGAALGGEQSGHILFRDGDATTGDGLMTALRVMEVMARTNTPLAGLIADLKVFPQKIQNVPVREKIPFANVPAVQQAIEAAERDLNGNGRVVVRYSGTEALARVMVEAESVEKMKALTAGIAEAIQQELGL